MKSRDKSQNISFNIPPTPEEHLRPNEEYGVNSNFKPTSSFMSSPQASYKAQAIKKAEKAKFLSLGYGVVAYFDTLAFFIKLFFKFSMISLFLLFIYRTFDGFEGQANSTRTGRYSLGNLG